MALSEEEQRLLDQLEAALAAEDPKLAHTLRGTPRIARRGVVLGAGAGFVAGMVALVGGMQLHPAVSVAGFVIMVVTAVLLVLAWQRPAAAGAAADSTVPGSTRHTPRMEDRRQRGPDEF